MRSRLAYASILKVINYTATRLAVSLLAGHLDPRSHFRRTLLTSPSPATFLPMPTMVGSPEPIPAFNGVVRLSGRKILVATRYISCKGQCIFSM